MIDTAQSFGDLIKRYRRRAGLTQEALAERAELSPRGLIYLERGERRPQPGTARRLADALGLDEEERVTFLATAEQEPPTTAAAPSSLPAICTFLIADIRGYTRFTADQGDEAAAHLAERFCAITKQVAAAQNGEVLELLGDEALVVFASARQALRAALDLQQRFAQETEADPSLPLYVGIGLDAGEAIPVDGGYRGSALNLAARLCSLAGPGEVLASDGVIHLARKVAGVEYVERGLVQLKGFADPVRVLQVRSVDLAADAERSSGDHVVAAHPEAIESPAVPAAPALPIGNFLGALPTAPLVAREEELARLQEALSTVEGSAGQMVLLTGELGIGKTRLAQEVTLLARNRGFLVATGRCFERHRSVSFFPFVEALTAAWQAAPSITRFQAPRRWPALAALIPELPDTPSSAPPAAPEEQQRLIRTVADFLRALSEAQPVALLLDDLQWADTETLELLQYLARHTQMQRLLLLGTYRDVEPDRSHPMRQVARELTREHLVERISLRRLSVEGTAAMVAAVIAETDGVSEFAEFVHRRTKGTPYYVDTMLQALGGHYRLVREIGAGGMGRVFAAVDTRTGERVAAKIMFSRSEADLAALQRFQQEGAVLSTLEHEHIVKVKGTFIEEHASCIIMELLDGQSLGQLMRAGYIELPRIKDLLTQVASALAYAHEHHIIHRDIKPDNVMVIEDDRVKVTDFGIARILRPAATIATMTSTGMTLGTPLYMAPEQIEGRKVDGRADIYSLGAMLYHVATGRPPFEGDDPITLAFKHVHEAPEPPSTVDARVPPDWEAVILKALAKDPADRFQSAREMEEAIVALRTEESPDAVPVSSVPSGGAVKAGQETSRPGTTMTVKDQQEVVGAGHSQPRRANPLYWAAGVMAAMVLGVGAFFMHQSTIAAKRLPPHTLLTVWGTVQHGSGAFKSPDFVRVGPQGDLYVLDGTQRIVLKLTPTGQLLARWTLNRPQPASSGPSCGCSTINDLEVDARGDIYIADGTTDSIEKYALDPVRGTSRLVARWGGTAGLNPGQLDGPTASAVDRTGNLYVTDGGNSRVQEFSPTGKPLAQWGMRGSAAGQFNGSSALALDASGNVYVTDYGNNRVEKLSPSGKVLATWGTKGSKPGQFNGPNDIQLDSQGNIYVVDRGNDRIEKFSTDGKLLPQFSSMGTGHGRLNLKNPTTVSVNAQGKVFVADPAQRRIDIFSPAGKLLGQWTVKDLLHPLLETPEGVAIDRSGDVIVTDPGYDRIDRFSPNGTLLASWGSTGKRAGQFQNPEGVAIDRQDNIYVADAGNERVEKYSPRGVLLAHWGTYGFAKGQFAQPTGVAVDGQGNIYVADLTNGRIQKLSPAGKPLTIWTQNSSGGFFPYTISDLTTDAQGDVYAADTPNGYVLKFSPGGHALLNWQPIRSGSPVSVALDGGGHLYMTSTLAPYVQEFATSGNLKPLAHWGPLGSGPGQFLAPGGIAVDKDGNIYVADTGNHRIEKFSPTG